LNVASVRIALIGCGLWGRNLLRELRQLGVTTLVADPDPRSRRVARALGAEGAFATLAELPAVDGFVVATPASTHFEVVTSLLDRGLSIFCEKPLTLNLHEAEELVRRGEEQIIVLHVWRHHPAVQAMRAMFLRGELGAVRWLRTTRVNWTSPRRDCDPIWTLLPHDLSIVLEITGTLPPVIAAHAEFSEHGPCGVIATLQGTFASVLEVSTRHAEKRREIRLHGDAAVAELSPDGTTLLVHSGEDQSVEPRSHSIPLGDETALTRQMAGVVGFLRGGPAPASSGADALLIATRMHEIRRMAGI
jgi:predicted dehydrogenase